MLPGDAPGRAPPGRGAPGRGACGRGIGRSTGCAVENGLLPTRGVRMPGFGAGPGRGPPGVGPGWAGLGAGALAAGADGRGGAGVGAGGAGGAGGADCAGATGVALGALAAWAVATPPPLDTAPAFDAALALAADPLPVAAALPPPNDSRNRRATGASTVDEADLTNSPCSLSRARTSLLVTPSSLANSCTRALPATTSPVWRRQRWWADASGLATTHGHRDFTVCSCSSLPVLSPGPRAQRSARGPRMCPVDR
jgi:hypothetical protein